MKKNINTFYCCALGDPWVEVAKKLNLKYNFTSVYWIGWNEDEALIEGVDKVIYHNMRLAWKGIFPPLPFDIDKPYLDGLAYKNLAEEELMAIKMMDRLDYDRNSFTFNERQFFFRNQLNKWINVLKKLDVNLIIAPSIPHRVFDYIIYVASKILKISFFTVKMTPWAGHLLPMDSVNSYISLPVVNSSEVIEDDVLEFVENKQKSYKEAIPYYMVNQKKDERKSKFRRIIETINRNKGSNINQLFRKKTTYWKKKGMSLEESYFFGYEVYLKKNEGINYKNKLKEYYNSLCLPEVDFNQPYILVALHYQPEETSCPSGDVFVDQNLMIKSLLKFLPKNIYIYVKEHSSQFNPITEGQTGREKGFYKDLIKHSRVKLVSLKEDVFNLIDNSVAIATLTGTIGIEAILRGKKAIVFGTAWYNSISGVINVKNEVDLNKISSYSFLSEPIDVKKTTKELNDIYKGSIRAYHYKGVKERSNISLNETVNNLTEFIVKTYSLNA